MSLLSIPTDEVLVLLANKLLPAGSGQNKILEVTLEVVFDNLGLENIKMCFWHPNNYMLVGYCKETEFDYQHGKYKITANHDSTWRYDGFSFAHKILKNYNPIEVRLKSFETLSVVDAEVDDDSRIFTFNIVH